MKIEQFQDDFWCSTTAAGDNSWRQTSVGKLSDKTRKMRNALETRKSGCQDSKRWWLLCFYSTPDDYLWPTTSITSPRFPAQLQTANQKANRTREVKMENTKTDDFVILHSN